MHSWFVGGGGGVVIIAVPREIIFVKRSQVKEKARWGRDYGTETIITHQLTPPRLHQFSTSVYFLFRNTLPKAAQPMSSHVAYYDACTPADRRNIQTKTTVGWWMCWQTVKVQNWPFGWSIWSLFQVKKAKWSVTSGWQNPHRDHQRNSYWQTIKTFIKQTSGLIKPSPHFFRFEHREHFKPTIVPEKTSPPWLCFCALKWREVAHSFIRPQRLTYFKSLGGSVNRNALIVSVLTLNIAFFQDFNCVFAERDRASLSRV